MNSDIFDIGKFKIAIICEKEDDFGVFIEWFNSNGYRGLEAKYWDSNSCNAFCVHFDLLCWAHESYYKKEGYHLVYPKNIDDIKAIIKSIKNGEFYLYTDKDIINYSNVSYECK